jgi:signal recognition particle receptor subunit beta
MPLVNYSSREITCKVVYYGPGRGGKTTNLQDIHARIPEARRGRMVSLATEMDRTLFFDFLPLELGTLSGFQVRFQLYTVPGQVYYDATRKLVLQGADGVVFVADSQARRQEENVESFRNLQSNLLAQDVDPRTIPLCLQFNKRDLEDAVTIEEMERALNYRGLRAFQAIATRGEGVFETLRGISELVLESIASRVNRNDGAIPTDG